MSAKWSVLMVVLVAAAVEAASMHHHHAHAHRSVIGDAVKLGAHKAFKPRDGWFFTSMFDLEIPSRQNSDADSQEQTSNSGDDFVLPTIGDETAQGLTQRPDSPKVDERAPADVGGQNDEEQVRVPRNIPNRWQPPQRVPFTEFYDNFNSEWSPLPYRNNYVDQTDYFRYSNQLGYDYSIAPQQEFTWRNYYDNLRRQQFNGFGWQQSQYGVQQSFGNGQQSFGAGQPFGNEFQQEQFGQQPFNQGFQQQQQFGQQPFNQGFQQQQQFGQQPIDQGFQSQQFGQQAFGVDQGFQQQRFGSEQSFMQQQPFGSGQQFGSDLNFQQQQQPFGQSFQQFGNSQSFQQSFPSSGSDLAFPLQGFASQPFSQEPQIPNRGPLLMIPNRGALIDQVPGNDSSSDIPNRP